MYIIDLWVLVSCDLSIGDLPAQKFWGISPKWRISRQLSSGSFNLHFDQGVFTFLFSN